MSSLPTVEAICQTTDDEDEVACQALLLQALSHGTDYDSFPKKKNLLECSEEAASVLVKAWSSTPTLQPCLVDALWLVGSQCHEGNEALSHIVKALVEQVPDREGFWLALQATLDPWLLEAAALLPGKEVLLKKVRKVNTETHYRQQKFNLMQEESEGYAKLLTLLLSSPLPTNVSTQIRDLVGTFELDPNRVLDLLLDVLETQMPSDHAKPAHIGAIETILKLIKEFSVDKIPYLLGFKISSSSSSPNVPHCLHATAAFLATEKILDIRAMSPHLSSIDEIHNAYTLFEKCERQKIQAMGRIRLNDGNNKGMDPKLEAEITKLNDATLRLEKNNSLVEMVRILLLWNEWDLAKQLLRDNTCSKVCALLPARIGHVLCDSVSERIQAVYRANVPAPLNETTLENPSPSQVPESASLDELLDAILEPLEGIMESACIASHPILYCQLCRLIKALLEKEQSTENLSGSAYWILKMLVSSLSLFPPNPAISADLWALLSIHPYHTRYSLYKEWRGGGLERAGLSTKPLAQVKCETEAGKAARYALKRLSKDNVRDMGRQVSKVTHSNPLVVFSTILSQVESYDNLIDMMVEAVRFVTPLGLDVLGYCILSRLEGTSDSGNRNRMKDDGVNASQWLLSLESFTGSFYTKCPQVEFRGILWYLIGRLKDGHVDELGILRTLLKTAGGYGFADYSPVASLATTQLEGRAGSQLLKRETFAFGVVNQTNQRASRIVRSVLQDDKMGVMLLILLAQIRTKVIFDPPGKRPKPVKLIGNLFDSCQVVMTMLLEFLTDQTDEALENGQPVHSSSSMKLYAESLPSLGDLYGKYGLDAESAWMLCRPISRAAAVERTSENGKGKHENAEAVLSFLPKGKAMTEIYRGMLPENAWEDMTVDLFELFFSHSLYDICCPESSYDAEILRLKREAERLIQRQKGNPGSLIPGPPFGKAEEMELERVQRASDILSSDMSLQKERREKMLHAFESRKYGCFPSETISRKSVQAFLMHCIYPRCMSSPDDAMYCARFVSLLHQNDTPGFSTLHYIDELLDVVAGALYCVTEGEAANMAIILLETWKLVSRWRYDRDAFAEEMADKPGSYFVLDGEVVSISAEQYETLYNKWHAKLGTVFMGSLNSSEYMVIRACLLVLTRIVDEFPTRPGLGQQLMVALEPIQQDSYPLQDIKTAAQAYEMLLGKARNEGVWKEEDAAVAEAREKEEKAALADRQKKAEERFEEMQAENEKITKELGPRDRDDRRRLPPRGPVESRSRDVRRSPLNPSAINFEPAKGGSGRPPSRDSEPDGGRNRRNGDDVRGRERDTDDGSDHRSTRIRETSARGPPDGHRGEATRAGAGRETGRRGTRDPNPGSLVGRWEPGATGQDSRATGKRGRSPDGDDERSSKRGRSDRDGDGPTARPPQGRPTSSDGARRDTDRSRNTSPSRRPPPREPQRTLRSDRRR